MTQRRALLAPVAAGCLKPPTAPHACCRGCGARHRVMSAARRVYCGCGRVLVLDWAR